MELLKILVIILQFILSRALIQMENLNNLQPLEKLCKICKHACDRMSPMINQFYHCINDETSKLKSDESVFTIADGIVQHLLVDYLFKGKFADIVGEEICAVNILNKPYTVEDLIVPDAFSSLIEEVRVSIETLGEFIDGEMYNDLTVFIDPIDGTREFSTALGEQCSVCIGFSDLTGKPVAGLVYRPITSPPTWALGAFSEGIAESYLNEKFPPNDSGFLTSNGKISPFISNLIDDLGYERVRSGGAGNKMLMLLEGKGAAYIQDRGVSRWDTLASQAVIEAHGGVLCKLTRFIDSQSIESYTYLKSDINADFEPGVARLTPYNAATAHETEPEVLEAWMFKPYANLCGFLALNCKNTDQLEAISQAISRVKLASPPSFD